MQQLDKFYLCGGAVRDFLLNKPVKDNDFVVLVDSFDAMREEILKNGGTIFIEKPEYLTIRGTLPNYGAADFVLPRTDGEYSDHRRPDTTNIASDLYSDSCRRDATINAMYKNLATGEILDFHYGKDDLARGIVRAVGKPEERIKEDALRLLRYFRISITKNFKLDYDLASCYVYSENTRLLQNVSAERIREEIFKCFKHDMHKTLDLLKSDYYKYLYEEIFNDRTKIWLKPTMEEK
jgi:tRNA nucleotidyltransferase (CCA-adding enzyme)